MDLKSRISTPLEAGTSILDVHRLPSYLVPALDYASKRLADKGLHITLLVARRDYQLPGYTVANDKAFTTRENPVTNLPSPPCSPASQDVVPCGASLNAIKALVRTGSLPSPGTPGRSEFGRLGRSKTGSLSKKPSIASLFDGSLGSPRLRWTSTANNGSYLPKTPRTPATPASCITTTSTVSSVAEGTLGAQGPDVRLIHTTSLAPRAYKLVAATLARASRKFNLSTTLTVHEPSTYNMPPVVLHSSILQNEVLHSSEGMTLLSLDHLYTFKTALNHYASTRSEPSSHFRLEDAVDELRRYILSSTAGRRRLLKSTLVQAYDWLGLVDDAALAEVTNMYSRAYGAATDMGVEDDLVQATRITNGSDSVVDSPTLSSKASSRSQTPLASTDGTTEQDRSSHAAEDKVDQSKTPASKSTGNTPVTETARTVDDASMEADVDDARDKTPVPSSKISGMPPALNIPIPVVMSQSSPGLSPSPNQTPTPKVKPRPSAPSLKLQTSFPTIIHKPTPKRKKTPVPSKRQSRAKTLPALPTSIFLSIQDATSTSSPNEQDIRIELVSPIDDDNKDNDNDVDDSFDTESLRTDFEDADLTARSPAKTPGGSIWLGIDDILSGHPDHHRRRSSDMFLQTPACEKMGPMTPNGYEDISPVTRGEWGFLMVGESFRTRTAGVTCV